MFKTFLVSAGVPLLLAIAVVLLYFILLVIGIDIGSALSFAILISPFWLPYVLFYLMYERWMYFVRTKFVVKEGRTTLRIKLPQEVFKSPEAMENVLTQAFYHNKPYNLMLAYLHGRHPLINSLEIAAHNGEVKFYVNVPKKKIKNIIEAAFYAEYPGVEIVEEPVDYTAAVRWDPEKWEMMSFHIVKKENEALPIRTYIDLGLDKMPKEEEKTDPMAPLIEHLSKVKPHEHIWVQVLIRPQLARDFSTGDLQKTDRLENRAPKVIDKIMGRDKKTTRKMVDRKMIEEEEDNIVRLTPGERDTIEAIERNVGKYGYDTAIRAMYIVDSTKQKFDGEMLTPLLSAFSQHTIITRNELGVRWRTDFDYPFIQDPTGKRVIKYKQWELEDYKNRYYYQRDYVGAADKPKVMSTEEIATIYHLPGKVIVSPGLTRIESQKRTAPANLPVGTPTHIPS